MTMYESFFIFDLKYYKQCDGVPLGPTLANVFMCHFENIWLENCQVRFKAVVYRRYVDDTFLPCTFSRTCILKWCVWLI